MASERIVLETSTPTTSSASPANGRRRRPTPHPKSRTERGENAGSNCRRIVSSTRATCSSPLVQKSSGIDDAEASRYASWLRTPHNGFSRASASQRVAAAQRRPRESRPDALRGTPPASASAAASHVQRGDPLGVPPRTTRRPARARCRGPPRCRPRRADRRAPRPRRRPPPWRSRRSSRRACPGPSPPRRGARSPPARSGRRRLTQRRTARPGRRPGTNPRNRTSPATSLTASPQPSGPTTTSGSGSAAAASGVGEASQVLARFERPDVEDEALRQVVVPAHGRDRFLRRRADVDTPRDDTDACAVDAGVLRARAGWPHSE